MALTIKSSDTAVAANAVIALQEYIEMGNKVSENIRNNIELFNKTADSFNGDFKEKNRANKARKYRTYKCSKRDSKQL